METQEQKEAETSIYQLLCTAAEKMLRAFSQPFQDMRNKLIYASETMGENYESMIRDQSEDCLHLNVWAPMHGGLKQPRLWA